LSTSQLDGFEARSAFTPLQVVDLPARVHADGAVAAVAALCLYGCGLLLPQCFRRSFCWRLPPMRLRAVVCAIAWLQAVVGDSLID